MALKNFNPVTPSLRGTVLIDRTRAVEGQAGQGADRGQALHRRAQQPRPHHQPVPRRRAQAPLPHHRLQAPQVRRAGDGRAAGIRPEPHRLHRADQVPGRRAGLYPGAAAAAVGDAVIAGARVDIKPGNAMPLAAIPVGTIVHNVEMKPGAGGKIARSAGHVCAAGRQGCRLRADQADVAASCAWCAASAWPPSARCPTPTTRTSRSARPAAALAGRRPHNRGVVMNPVDHPHGGGEGRTSGGRHPVTPWGKPTKGYKTRVNKRTDQPDHPPPQQGQG